MSLTIDQTGDRLTVIERRDTRMISALLFAFALYRGVQGLGGGDPFDLIFGATFGVIAIFTFFASSTQMLTRDSRANRLELRVIHATGREDLRLDLPLDHLAGVERFDNFARDRAAYLLRWRRNLHAHLKLTFQDGRPPTTIHSYFYDLKSVARIESAVKDVLYAYLAAKRAT